MSLGKLLYPLRGRDAYLAWNRLEAAPETLTLASPAFADGAPMPRRHAGLGLGENLSPPLTIAGVPQAAAALLLVLQDPDAPLPRPVVHLIAALPPGTTELAEGALNEGMPVAFGRGTFGRRGYHGPRPLRGHGVHRYVFQLFALREPAPHGGNLAAQLAALQGKVLARGCLTGIFVCS